MSDIVHLKCPKCQTTWEQNLEMLEIWRPVYLDTSPDPDKNIFQYRAQCRVCGTYVIFDVEDEEEPHA